jgi:hypothetical protein
MTTGNTAAIFIMGGFYTHNLTHSMGIAQNPLFFKSLYNLLWKNFLFPLE